MEVESMDAPLFDFSMQLSTALDVQVCFARMRHVLSLITLASNLIRTHKDTVVVPYVLVLLTCLPCVRACVQFSKSPKTVFSQKDVPGVTRGAVPLLAARGVQMIHVGVNDETTPPAVCVSVCLCVCVHVHVLVCDCVCLCLWCV